MDVALAMCLTGAAQARGTAVVIDVFRASTTACCLLAQGVTAIYPADSPEEALAWRQADPSLLLVGERNYRRPEGFDHGNSPSEILALHLAGRRAVLATTAGSRGLLAAAGRAEDVVMAGFVNAGAVIRYLCHHTPQWVSLLAMGTQGLERTPEDDLCALYLKNALEDYPNAFPALDRHLRTVASAQKFYDPEAEYAPEADLDLCLSLDRFDFVPRLERAQDGRWRLVRHPVPPFLVTGKDVGS